MAKFTVTINTDNDAFSDDPANEIALILRRVAEKTLVTMDKGHYSTTPIRDSNGNTVGKYVYTR